ncbi:MAG: hypothetical protein EOR68_09175 [Mesorhizobium sp.]|uniref:hypothetical protein n=1 Tax=Mesorhizobium sp. TaxID=1871066 RepID=UPI000FE6F637|nr:hypothetical protein [Mesorhizobium sp.]RWM01753.1 MAG: hypothetical protein EOR68_09175 [Mesorhizobium sp.]TIP51275.1 MAG: hypothetical protein E5X77_02660 [Mesorhizobium sp.]
MIELTVLEMAVARQRARRADRSLKHATALLDEDHGLAVSLALCCRIRAGQARVKAAKRRLLKISPTAH